MQILAVDIGTGTQDILLYDSRVDLENCFKLVVPSPTMIFYRRIQDATKARLPIALSGTIMGGGPCQWAAETHIKTGLPVYATPSAAQTFNDDLEVVQNMGVKLVSEDELAALPGKPVQLEMKDFDFTAISTALRQFGVSLKNLDAVAVAVFDHGDSPPGYSDRQFRFDYLDQRIRAENHLSAFAYTSKEVPQIMTRLQAVKSTASSISAPLVVMDTAPAAVFGATFDTTASRLEKMIITNIGNFHTLAFRLSSAGIEGVFEHHTGLINRQKLESLLVALANSTLTHQQVFDDHGHGALIYEKQPLELNLPDTGIIITGPRRSLLRDSLLHPHFAAPFGDMMISGCFGLLAATARKIPAFKETILASLNSNRQTGNTPWEF